MTHNTLVLNQKKNTSVLTYGGVKPVRNFNILVNGVVVDTFSEGHDYGELLGKYMDEAIKKRLKVYEKALGCKVSK
jgi:hypothetical protein